MRGGRTKLRIAMLGTKGIPAKWGGIEKYVEEISSRLVDRGHTVKVYCSKWYCREHTNDIHKGINIIRLPVLNFQSTAALNNALIASIHSLTGKYDIIHLHGYASYLFIPLLRKFCKRVVITAHGVESGWNNPKYNYLARSIIKHSFEIGLKSADQVTTVASHLQKQILAEYGVKSVLLPSGIDDVAAADASFIKKFGLEQKKYILFIGRLDPVKRIEWLADLPELANNLKIVIAGGPQDTKTKSYCSQIVSKSRTRTDLIFTGPVSGDLKNSLINNCLIYVSPSQYEGLPITLLEAVSCSRCCFVSDIPAHNEIINDGITGFTFPANDKDEFVSRLNLVLSKPAGELESVGSLAKRMCFETYNWEKTTTRLENIYESITRSCA